MSSADLFEDGYPHGTVEGFLGGCKGGSCPAGVEHGLSCKRAKMLAAGDYRYPRLVAEGKTPAEIAAIINGPTTTPATPARTHGPTDAELDAAFRAHRDAATPTKETPAMTTEAPKPTPPRKPLTVDPVVEFELPTEPESPTPDPEPSTAAPANDDAEVSTPISTDRWTSGLSVKAKTKKLRQIREWARANGFPGVPVKGKIPQDALAAYAAASEGDATAVGPTGERSNEEAEDLKVDAAGNAYTEILDEARERAYGTENALSFRSQTGFVHVEGALIEGSSLLDGVAIRSSAAKTPDQTPEQEIATGSAVDQTSPAEVEPHRVDWADVATSHDVEQARALTARMWDENELLEQQVADLQAQLATAQTALELTLTKWAQEKATTGKATSALNLERGASRLMWDMWVQAERECAAWKNAYRRDHATAEVPLRGHDATLTIMDEAAHFETPPARRLRDRLTFGRNARR